MRIIHKLFLVIFVLSIYSTVFAVEGEEKTKIQEKEETKLEEIVVTATRTEKPVTEAPGSVSVVTKEDMEKRNIKAVDEALNLIPGVFNKRGKGLMDTTSHISLRGIPKDFRTLTLLDGTPLNNAYGGDVNWGGVAYENIEKIEIVKGPFSSLYGGYAMGGVVNILTKMPEKRESTFKIGYGSSWDRGEGLDDLRKFYLSYGDKFKDKLSIFLSYGYKATNGYPSDFNAQSRDTEGRLKTPPVGITGYTITSTREGDIAYLIGDKGENRWWDDGITLKAQYEFTKDTKLNLSFMRNRYEYNYDDPHTYLRDAAGNPVREYTYYDIKKVRENTFLSGSGGREQNGYNLSYETEISTVKAKLSLGLIDQEKNWYTSPGTTATRAEGTGKISSTPSEGYNADLQFTIPLFKRHILTFGGSFRHNWADTKEHNLTNWKDEDSKTTLTFQSKGKDRTYALFLQDEIIILDNLTAYIGLRQDWWETYDGYINDVVKGYLKEYPSASESSLSPKAALVYKPFEKTILRTSIGKAFRPPTVYEIYRTWTWGKKIYVGNTDLKPETTTSWDVGVEQGLWKGAKAGITYFENYMKDFVYYHTISPAEDDKCVEYDECYKYKNVGKAEGRGVELEIEQKFGKWLRLFGNFTYNNAKVKENPAKPETEGKRLTYLPERMFNVGGDFEKGPFSINLTGRYVSKIYVTDENKDKVNNVYGSYDPYLIADAKVSYKVAEFATLSLSVDNIFDRDYFSYYKAPGRSWFTELTMRF